MQDNGLLLNSEGQIEDIGKDFFSYFNLKLNTTFAYPPGKLEKGDFIIYLDSNIKKIKPKEAEFIMEGKIFDALGENNIILMCEYKNQDTQTICKQDKQLFVAPNIIIDTYFGGNSINIKMNESQEIFIAINQQEIRLPFHQDDNQMIVFNEKGIKYFKKPEDRRIYNLEKILSEEYFEAYSMPFNYGENQICIEEIFLEEFIVALQTIEEGIPTEFVIDKIPFFIEKSILEIHNNRFLLYLLYTQKNLLHELIDKSFSYKKLRETANKKSVNHLSSAFNLLGENPLVKEVEFLLNKAAATNVTILLTGESGTGKTFMARKIHENSKRYTEKFIHVNCAAIPYNLIESELFGYEEGSFTGAKKGGKKGYFELGESGTVFLDEITELPLSLQGKLLEVIQNKTFYRIGGFQKIKNNVRLIVASNRNLQELVVSKKFREDLFYRINVFPIELPPLRKRKDALFEIITAILPEICQRVELEPLIMSSIALEKMFRYDWPGNIRELENILEKAAILCDGKVINSEDIFLPISHENNSETRGTLKEQRENLEKQIIKEMLIEYNGEKTKIADRLGIGRTNLFEKIRKYELERAKGDIKNDTK